jgi:hypothetical protein
VLPTWLIEHRPPRSVHLLMVSSDTDPPSHPQSLEFLRREQKVPRTQACLVQGLGRSLDTYPASLAPILDWLSAVAKARAQRSTGHILEWMCPVLRWAVQGRVSGC